MSADHDNQKIREARESVDKANRLRRHGVAKVIDFREEYITCLTCDCCYGVEGRPEFCQRLSCAIDPREVIENMDRAKACRGWFPRVIGRRVCGEEYSADDERWYERDSMG